MTSVLVVKYDEYPKEELCSGLFFMCVAQSLISLVQLVSMCFSTESNYLGRGRLLLILTHPNVATWDSQYHSGTTSYRLL